MESTDVLSQSPTLKPFFQTYGSADNWRISYAFGLPSQIYKLQGMGYHMGLVGYRRGQQKITLKSWLFDDEELEAALTEPSPDGGRKPNPLQESILKLVYRGKAHAYC